MATRLGFFFGDSFDLIDKCGLFPAFLALWLLPQAKAQMEGVQIHSHKVIYRFLDDVKAVMSSLLPPVFKETVIGEAQILQVSQSTLFYGSLTNALLLFLRTPFLFLSLLFD